MLDITENCHFLLPQHEFQHEDKLPTYSDIADFHSASLEIREIFVSLRQYSDYQGKGSGIAWYPRHASPRFHALRLAGLVRGPLFISLIMNLLKLSPHTYHLIISPLDKPQSVKGG